MGFDRSGGADRSKPFNVASYSPLAMMAACVTGHEPGELVNIFGDLRPCLHHLDRADRQLARDPLPVPRARIHGGRWPFLDYRYEDVDLLDYRHHPAILAPVSV